MIEQTSEFKRVTQTGIFELWIQYSDTLPRTIPCNGDNPRDPTTSKSAFNSLEASTRVFLGSPTAIYAASWGGVFEIAVSLSENFSNNLLAKLSNSDGMISTPANCDADSYSRQ